MIEMEKFYKEYGKFIIHFENINFNLCYIIRNICTKQNMFSDDDQRVENLLEGLTAYPILAKFKSIFLTLEISQNEELLKLVSNFYKNFLKIIELRNFIAHGTFFPGDPHGNLNKFEIRKPKLNNKGFHQNVNVISIEALIKLNSDLIRLENFIDNLNTYISDKTPEEFRTLVFNNMKKAVSGLEISLNIESQSIQL